MNHYYMDKQFVFYLVQEIETVFITVKTYSDKLV